MSTKLQLPALHIPNGNPYEWKVRHTRPGNLVGYWPLNEVAGTTAYDHSGNGFHGTYNGSPLLGQRGIGDGWTSPYFDGVDDRVSLPVSRLSSIIGYWPKGTAVVWSQIDPTCWSTDNIYATFRIYGNQGDDASSAVFAYESSNNVYFTQVSANHSGRGILLTKDKLYLASATTWNIPNITRGYRNGTFGIMDMVGYPWLSTSISGGNIGCYDLASYFWFKGWISHLAIWNTELSLSEVQEVTHL